MVSAAHGLHFITIGKRLSYTKARYITTFRLVIFRIPVARNLDRILFIENWIKERLLRQARRESLVLAIPDSFEFLLTYRTKQKQGIRFKAIHWFNSMTVAPDPPLSWGAALKRATCG